MAITRLSNSGIKTGVLKYDSMLAGNPAYSPAAFESIATITATGSSPTVTFTSIPSTYQHLQIRASSRSSGGGATYSVNFNSDSTTSYSSHRLFGAAGGVQSGYQSNNTAGAFFGFYYGDSNSYPMPSIIDILDYANTNKYKTLNAFCGSDTNGAGEVALTSVNWRNTNAINTIAISTFGSNFQANSTFALYGIRG